MTNDVDSHSRSSPIFAHRGQRPLRKDAAFAMAAKSTRRSMIMWKPRRVLLQSPPRLQRSPNLLPQYLSNPITEVTFWQGKIRPFSPFQRVLWSQRRSPTHLWIMSSPLPQLLATSNKQRCWSHSRSSPILAPGDSAFQKKCSLCNVYKEKAHRDWSSWASCREFCFSPPSPATVS